MKKFLVLGLLSAFGLCEDTCGINRRANVVNVQQEDERIEDAFHAIRTERNSNTNEELTGDQLNHLPASARGACRMLHSIREKLASRERLSDAERAVYEFCRTPMDEEPEMIVGRFPTSTRLNYTDEEIESAIWVFFADSVGAQHLWLDCSSVSVFSTMEDGLELARQSEGATFDIMWNEERDVQPEELELLNAIGGNVSSFMIPEDNRQAIVTEDLINILRESFNSGCLRYLCVGEYNCNNNTTRSLLIELTQDIERREQQLEQWAQQWEQ